MRASVLQGIRTILFDFEGTLVDFQWNLRGAVEDVLTMLEAAGIRRSLVKSRKYSTLMPEAMRLAPTYNLSPESIRQSIGEIYDTFDEDALTRWSVRPGAKDFITQSKGKGTGIGLVSNIGKKTLSKARVKLGLEGMFDTAVCRNDVRAPKPDPEGILRAMESLHARKGATLFIGDSLDDIHAAKNARIKVIVITKGENLTEEIKASSPDGIIQGYSELLE